MEKPNLHFNLSNRSNLVLGLKIVTIFASTLAIFRQDLVIIINDALHNDATNYVLTIPFLFAYLIYRKRKMLKQVIALENKEQNKLIRQLPQIMGILLSTAALFFYWYGSYTFTPLEYHMFALPLFIAGLVLFLFNTQTLRQLVFPIIFLILLTPPPSQILYNLGSTLSMISSEASCAIVKVLGLPCTLTTEYGSPIITIITPQQTTMSFAIDIACSGIYSLFSFLVFAIFVTYLIRDKPWKKLSIFVTGLLIIYLLNIARITTILIIGYYANEQIAIELFHLLGGWVLIFIGTFLLLFFAEKVFHTQIFTKQTQKCIGCTSKSTTNPKFCLICGRILKPAFLPFNKIDLVKIIVVIFSVMLLVSIQTPVFALTEGPAQIMIQTASGEQGNTQLLPQIEGYTLAFAYRDTNFEEMAEQDASLLYVYQPVDKTEEIVWVAIEIGSPMSLPHRWEGCLISLRVAQGKSPLVTQIDLKDIPIQENPPIIARYFAFQWVTTEETQVVLYWYENARFMTNDTAQEKSVKISLIAYPSSQQNITTYSEKLIPVATEIVKHWQPIKTWMQLSLLLSQNGIYLAALTTVLLIGVIVLYGLENRKQKKANSNVYQKLSKQTKQIIDIVREAQETAIPTLSAIATKYRNKTKETIEKEELFHRLLEAEKTGIIKSYIANKQDEPIQAWKLHYYPIKTGTINKNGE